MITDETIDKTLIECMRTMKALKALRHVRKHPGVPCYDTESIVPHSCVKEHAAAKRASLDLTRMLANLRAGR